MVADFAIVADMSARKIVAPSVRLPEQRPAVGNERAQQDRCDRDAEGRVCKGAPVTPAAAHAVAAPIAGLALAATATAEAFVGAGHDFSPSVRAASIASLRQSSC